MTHWINKTLSERVVQADLRHKVKRYKASCPDRNPSGPSLNPDIVSVIANILASERDNNGARLSVVALRALASLNRVSRALHEVTLPYLYQTTEYTGISDVVRSLETGPPRGWLHIRYLFVQDTALALMELLLQRLNCESSDSPCRATDVTASFPSIVFMAVSGSYQHHGRPNMSDSERPLSGSTELKLVILRHITFAELRRLCMPRRNPHIDQDVCFFGIQLVHPEAPNRTSYRKSRIVDNISSVDIRKGGGILPPFRSGSLTLEANAVDLLLVDDFALDFEDQFPTSGTSSTVGLALDSAKFLAQCQRGQEPSDLDLKQPLCVRLNVWLRGQETTERDMVRHLESIADSFSRHWTYDMRRRDCEFVSLSASISVPSEMVKEYIPDKDVRIRVTGSLMGGLHIPGAAVSEVGFTAIVRSEVCLDRFGYHTGNWLGQVHRTEFEYTRYYRCAHVPLPEDWEED
ncbi:hypothetical protein QFC21_006475 [Naganishia friedmannii]|uniref:Uncharacterized protein n=1 Tax=Naganishia friedmannii TaxID=89922 RepID=A0ACC2V1F3_9TREE|nr:hypothetical protein QFC21_006475 [Naganishia friedmannii]